MQGQVQRVLAAKMPSRRSGGTWRAMRAGVAGMLGAIGLLLAGCAAQGAGLLGAPAPGSDATGTWPGGAAFVFNYRCDVRDGRAVATGELFYRDTAPSKIDVEGATREFPAFALHGVASATPAGGACGDSPEIPAVQFEGEYRRLPLERWTRDTAEARSLPFGAGRRLPDRPPEGRFVVLVFDQGPRGGPSGPDVTGDAFSIELFGGPLDGYTRAGYIERGDVRVR